MPKILFIRGGAVGDFLLTLPALKLVRDNLPDLEIEILGYPSIAEVAVTAGLADRVKSIEHASLAPFFAPGSQLNQETCDYFAEFDVVVSYLYDPDGFFEANLERAGVKTLFTGPFRMEESEPYRPASVQLASPLESLALYLEKPWIEVKYPKSIEPEADNPIAIHPGSGSPSKNWSFESWVEILRLTANEVPNSTFYIVSGEAEQEVLPDFLYLVEAAGLPYRSIANRPLPELASVLQGCRFFLGHDSGISHLAATTGIPSLLLFGPTNPAVWAPTHPSVSVHHSVDHQLSGIAVSEVMEDLRQKIFTGL